MVDWMCTRLARAYGELGVDEVFRHQVLRERLCSAFLDIHSRRVLARQDCVLLELCASVVVFWVRFQIVNS